MPEELLGYLVEVPDADLDPVGLDEPGEFEDLGSEQAPEPLSSLVGMHCDLGERHHGRVRLALDRPLPSGAPPSSISGTSGIEQARCTVCSWAWSSDSLRS